MSEKLKIQLEKLIESCPRNFMRVLKSKANGQLLDELTEKTKFLSKNATLKTRIFWILNGISSWNDKLVCCKICRKPLDNFNVLSITKGYKKTCSKKCERKLAQEQYEKTCENKYGCKNAFQIDDVKEKLLENQKEIQKKRDETRQMHFKNEKGWNLSKSLKTRLEKYGHAWNIHAVKFTKFKKYGNCNWNNIEKNIHTKRKNGTFNTSSQEIIAHELICQKFTKNDVIWQYKSEKYPFLCDFYVKSLDLYIECNFSWTHGGMFFDENNENCIQKLNDWKEKAKTSRFYENALKTWTIRDIKKLKTAQENKLNYKVFWTLDEILNWKGEIV